MMMEDRRRGCLFGQAIGDALGAFYEFDGALRPDEKAQYKDTRTGFLAGEWTDDTEQALVLTRAFTKSGDDMDKAVLLIADGFLKWLGADGRGCGNHTAKVLTDSLYSLHPLDISQAVWEDSGRKSAPNGSVMRVAGVAIVRPWDKFWTNQASSFSSQTTHYDYRCVGATVAAAMAMASLMRGEGIHKALAVGEHCAHEIDPRMDEWLKMSLEELDLGGKFKGFVGKCVGAGFWALREFQRQQDAMYDDLWPDRFEEILNDIIRQGGDIDTNAAVAGAMMGAHIGLSNLPKRLVDGLVKGSLLESICEALPKEPTP